MDVEPAPRAFSRHDFFFKDTAPTEIYTLSLHDALPIRDRRDEILADALDEPRARIAEFPGLHRSEEHTSELQSRRDLVCRLLLEKKKTSRPVETTYCPPYTRS